MNRHCASCFISTYVGRAERQIVECSIVFEWMLLLNGGGIWYVEGEVAVEGPSGHHEQGWGRMMPHACELTHAPYARRLLEDQDALTHANSPFRRHCPPHKDVEACTTCSISCVTSVLPEYTVAILLLPAVFPVPMGSKTSGTSSLCGEAERAKVAGHGSQGTSCADVTPKRA